MDATLKRAGIAVGAIAAALFLCAAFVVQGYVTASAAAKSVPLAAQEPASSSSPTALAPEVIYVRPAPSPEVIHVVRTEPPAEAAPPVSAQAGAGEHERDGDDESGDDR